MQLTSQFNGIRFNLVAIKNPFLSVPVSQYRRKNYEKKNSFHEKFTKPGLS